MVYWRLLEAPLWVLLKKIANPMITVKFATLDPRKLPTKSPPSPTKAATVETESSGKNVVTESKMKPAAISDNPNFGQH